MKTLRWLSSLLILVLCVIALPGIAPAPVGPCGEFDIDIKPGSDLNPINPNARGVVTVAILGSIDCDVTLIDVDTLIFGPFDDGGASPMGGEGHFEDVNEDGHTDLVLLFRIQETGIEDGDVQACLSGFDLVGVTLVDCDSIRTVPVL